MNGEILGDQTPATQFGRAMGELDVELILARSPQAKGRVERMNGTLQDRLVKTLRRAGISDIASANRFLDEQFLPDLNGRFTVSAAASEDHHRAVTRELDLPRILSIQEDRVVQNDWTVRWQNRILQLARESSEIIQPRQRVTLCEQLDGVLRVFAGQLELSWSATRSEPQGHDRKPPLGHPTGSSQGQKPRADHPWRGQKGVRPSPS